MLFRVFMFTVFLIFCICRLLLDSSVTGYKLKLDYELIISACNSIELVRISIMFCLNALFLVSNYHSNISTYRNMDTHTINYVLVVVHANLVIVSNYIDQVGSVN